MQTTKITCEAEEKLASFQMPGNNTFPLWCYGAPTIVRYQDDLYATLPDVAPDTPPLCNTRLQVFRKHQNEPWQRIFVNPTFNQREPCPIASLGDGRIIVSINTAITPFRGNEKELMWNCEPGLLCFDQGDAPYPELLKPRWDVDWPFTDHSYRGISADAARHEMFIMNIEGYRWKPGPEGRYHWAFWDEKGHWAQNGRLDFPLRCCYPCISLKDRRVNIVAISDVDEPNPTWMAYKRDYAGIPWDYDFRKLYFAYAADIAEGGFEHPVLVENCDNTAGHIKHTDLYVDDDNVAYVVYIARNISRPFMRDKFWPGEVLTAELKVARIKEGKILSKQVIARCTEDPQGALWTLGAPIGEKHTGDSFRTNDRAPNYAAFHAASDGRLFLFFNLGGFDAAGQDLSTNYLQEITPGRAKSPVEVAMQDPMKIFFTTPQRNGSTRSSVMDIFGLSLRYPDQINYARIKI